MFRLISLNAQLSLRPVLLQQVKNNKAITSIPALNIQTPSSQKVPRLLRQNSTATRPSRKVDKFISNAQKDPLLKDAFESETSMKLEHFQLQVVLAHQYRGKKDKQSRQAFTSTIFDLIRLVEDPELRASFDSNNLHSYTQLLNVSVFHNRLNRLTGLKDRDSDQKNSNVSEEVQLKRAVLSLGEHVMAGEFNRVLAPLSLSFLFYAMAQFHVYPEIIDLWEKGVNDEQVGRLYLNERILGVILPIAYDIKRFTYEEILHIYELNTRNSNPVHNELLSSIGKVSIMAGDYSRGLDSLEALLKLYEADTSLHKVLGSLSDLHLSFIGACKDIKIAKHFFDKVMTRDLPYVVRLKVPHVQSLIENAYEAAEPFDDIVYFWRSTILYYAAEKERGVLNSRYSILNNTIFSIFFKMFPELTPESFDKLKQMIATYAEIKSIDEMLLNTIITNYSWGNKEVLERLIENYDIYNVERTQVSYRICLKKAGSVGEYTNEEILAKWNQSLQKLDQDKFHYVPIADWAALRDSTIKSGFPDRKLFYLQVLNKYKNYLQDERSVSRFVVHWSKNAEHFGDIKQVAQTTGDESFGSDMEVEVPQFTHLRPNVNFNEVSARILN